MAAAPVQTGRPAHALLGEARLLQGGEGGGVGGVGDGFHPVQGQFTEGQVGEGGQGVDAVPLAAVLGGEQEVGLGGAVDEGLLVEGYVADGGVVREQDEEVVPGAVLGVGDEPFAQFVEGPGQDPISWAATGSARQRWISAASSGSTGVKATRSPRQNRSRVAYGAAASSSFMRGSYEACRLGG